jgi:hypothetical protein
MVTDRSGGKAPAQGLTVSQLAEAAVDETTILPLELRQALARRQSPVDDGEPDS